MTSATVDQAGDRTYLRTIIVGVGFTLGWTLGLAGAAVGAGTTQDVLYSISSIGLTTGAVVLAMGMVTRNVMLASGMALLAIGEAVIHTQGPGGPDAFAAATLSYFPALVLAALSGWGPLWARVASAVSGAVFGVYAIGHAAGADVALDGPIAGVGYLALSLALIGWTWHLVKHSEANQASGPAIT